MRYFKLLLIILLFLLLNGLTTFAEPLGFTYDTILKEVESFILINEKITLNALSSIIVDNIDLTYTNYEYYRKDIKDTSNRDILKLYSEGILQGDGKGNMNSDRVLTDTEIFTIIDRLASRTEVKRPEYKEIKGVPILMYHEVNTLPKNGPTGLYVHPKAFINQLEALESNGYSTVTMEQVYQHWANKVPLPDKPIVLTFDDGYISHYDFVSVELAKKGMVGTFYIITSNINNDTIRTSKGVKEMYDIGMEIGSHTVNHADARHTKNETLKKEYEGSKIFLENITGSPVRHLCYPIGGTTPYAIKLAEESGYVTSVVTKYGKASNSQGLLTLKRIRVDYNNSVSGFLSLLK